MANRLKYLPIILFFISLTIFSQDKGTSLYTTSNELISNHITSVEQESSILYWVGTKKGVSRMYFVKGRPKILNRNMSVKVNQVLNFDKDYLWVATNGKGLFKLDKRNFKLIGYKADLLKDYKVTALVYASSNEMWAATKENGLYYINLDGGEYNKHKVNNIVRFTKSGGKIFGITQTGNAYTIEGKKVDKYKTKDVKVNDIYVDKENKVWLASKSNGVYLKKGATYINYTKEDELYSNEICGFINTPSNDFLTITSQGLSRFKMSKGKFGKIENPKSYAFENYSGFYDSKDMLWLSTNKGLLKYNSSFDNVEIKEASLALNSIQLFDEKQELKNFQEFKYDDYFITFNVSTEGLGNPDKIKFKYQLKGFDQKPVEVGNLSQIKYKDIGHGDFEFAVQASNDKGDVTKEIIYNFSVAHPLKDSMIWYIAGGIALIFYTYLIYLISTIKKRKDIKVLEEAVIAKSGELNELKANVKQKENSLVS